MEKIVTNTRLIIKTCDLYYNKKWKHQEIADFLNISRPTVSRILACALEQKIVNITINNLESVRYWELEQRLKTKFELRDVIVVDSDENIERTKRALGCATRRYLEGIIQERDVVGISMGSTLYYTVNGTFENKVKNLTVIPLIGGMGQLKAELHSNHLADDFTKCYGGTYLPLYAPARVSNSALRKHLKKEQGVAEVLQLQKKVSIALVGIGFPNEQSSIAATGYYKKNEIQSLLERQVAGEICMQFYDSEGHCEQYKNDNNVIGIELNRLRKIPYSIGIAGGKDKISAIKGATNGKYINVLITDCQCAELLLNKN
ncbi:MAG: sugar-binding transcriptional regulator [Clostridia bacterium]|nr:sugar-binding transcriptional regulator [Clostridia bacterium]